MEGVGELSGSLEREQVAGGGDVVVGVDVGRKREGIYTVRKGATGQEDGIGLPPSECPEGGLVDSGDEQGGGSPGACAVGGDAGRKDVGDAFDNGSGCTKLFCEHSGGDLMLGTGWVEVGVQRVASVG